jgi:hypothetical protein
MPKNSARARPRECSSNVCTTMASAAGNMIAPPRPWTTRKATIQVSARLPRGVRPHNADAPAKTITPSTTIRRCPTVSARRPPNANRAARDSRYALIAHCMPLLDRPRSSWILGAAIETMVWSMKVIATAKIMAVSTRFLRPAPAPGLPPMLIGLSGV